ncbi:MAG: hypothetical protein HOG34_20010 [Bacteroidetes bacterium]|jgi:C-terminal processing protease CtpA/Prc|nr:hypothetical protein [Bacteroidota bacterium]MBT4967441.1 hypothetical protein [Bacteroidota bacterium]
MNKTHLLTTFVILILTNSSFGQFANNKDLITQTKLIEDYDFMLKTLEETHPNLYAYIPKTEFLNKTDELRKSINRPLSKPEFYKVLLKTISLVKQGHTMVFGDPGFGVFLKEGGLSFPFTIKYDEGHIFIDENFSANKTISKGTELIAINRIPVSQIISDLTPYLRVRLNGFIGSTLEFNWARYLWLIYGFDKTFTISYILPTEDIIRTESIEGVNKEPRKKKYSYTDKINLHIDRSKKLAIMNINTFEFDFEVYDSLLYNSFKSIKENKIENLIIDVRENRGGNGNLLPTLINYLTDKPYIISSSSQIKTSEATRICYTTHPVLVHAIEQARKAEKNSEDFLRLVDCFLEKPAGTITEFPKEEVFPTDNENRFLGNLYVLTSHNTYSAGTIFSAVIKDNNIGNIVGEETSDNPTIYACIMLFELPNTKINIQNSTQYCLRPAGYDDQHGVIPDFRVKQTYSEFLNGTDKVMNYTYWLINEGITKRNIDHE